MRNEGKHRGKDELGQMVGSDGESCLLQQVSVEIYAFTQDGIKALVFGTTKHLDPVIPVTQTHSGQFNHV